MKIDASRATSWGAALAALAAILAWMLWPRPEPVDFVDVTRGPLMVTLDAEGETRVRERFVVSAPVAGRMLRVELEPGDRVTAGVTVLAVLQPREPTLLDPRSRAEAEAQVRALEAELERAKHERDAARAELEFAAIELRRAERLAKDRVLSAEKLEERKLAARRSSETLDAAEHAIEGAEFRLTSVRARLLDLGDPERRGDDPISIRAPVDGVVLRRIHESEAVVAPGERLLEIGDTSGLEIVADYLSSDAVRIRPGSRALVERWGGQGVLQARVQRVEPSGFTKISALGVEEKRVNVVLDLLTPATERMGLSDGFRVETRIVVWEGDDVIRAPAGSLFRHGDGWAAFAVEEGRARLQPIEIGERTPAAVEVKSGLVEGDQVIAHPGDAIEDGARVAARTLPY